MITRNMMAGGSSVPAVFEFKYTVTTNASDSSDKKSALPINLYGQTGVEISVDWGDGSTSVLKPSDYTDSSSLASVHEYASAGTYQITASSSNWSNAYLLSCYADATISSANNANQPVYWWRRTLKSVDSPLPPVKGVMRLASASATSMTASDNDLGFLFHRCEKMTSIPANLFENAGHIEEFNSTFYNCIILPSIPAGLFDPCVSALNFSDCFRYCLALTSIPVSFFKYCTAATNMYNVFRFCNKIPSVPADLFLYNTHVTNMGGAFSKCDALKNFQLCIGSPNVATVTDFILNASGVTRIVCVPANSTTYNSFNSYKNTSNNVTVSTNNEDCGIEEDDGTWKFTIDTEATASEEKKTGIPFNLYGQTGIELTVDWGDNTTSTLTPSDYTASDSTASVHEYAAAGEYTVTVASNDWENTYLLFYDFDISSDSSAKTSSLYWFRRTATSIDTKLPQIKGVVNADTLTAYNNSLKCLFYNSNKITSIPSGLFDSNTAVTIFNSCFDGCSSLASIPSGLFDKNTAVTSFGSSFSYCSSLASIPAGLFDKNTEVTNFARCFSYCSSLQSIPSGLFDNNTAVTGFSGCFQGCSSLQSIPSGLFDKNTVATSFDYCFSYCSLLQSIPSGLFDNNTAVTSFNTCFSYCSSLQSIPSKLFDKNTAVKNFSNCFYNCSSLQSIPSGMFAKNTAVTSFQQCFYGCTNLLNFHLKIGSSSVTTFNHFVSNASNVDRILCVPANSTTYTTASSYANNSNNIIVSTDFIDCSEAWEFTIDTEATASGEKKTGIPFNLYGQTGVQLLVDWGDNTTSRLTPSDYTASDSTASVHEYAATGEYNVTVISNNWENTYIYTATISKPASADPRIPSNNNYCNMLYWSTRTFIALTNPIPQIKGVKDISIYNGSSPSGDSVTSSAYTSNNSINSIFAYYQKIQTISVNLFQKIPFTNFGNIFYYCTSLQSIPSELFNNNSAATSFVYSFANCTSLQSIPTGLFDNTSANNFDHCFYNCTSLTSIPSGLFDKNTEVTSAGFRCVFCNCTSLQSIPSGLFDKNTKVTDFLAVFYGCTSLASIPSGLFDKNTKVAGTFGFSECFRDCTSLTSIPSGLFDKNTNVTRFSECFSGCTSLASIPSGLFDKNTKAVSFDSVFYGCTSLASIPSGLFDKNTAAVTFDGCFAECTSLQSIPSGLFNKNTAATTFGGLGYYQGCFRNCTSLQSIPSGLFDNNTAVTTFQNCFYGCTSLQSIPSGLFDNNTAVTNFGNCFSDCTNLLNFHLKISSSSVTTFSNFISNASNVDRILCVPADSTTYTTASSYANSSNNIIVSTDYIDCAEVWEFTIDTEAVVSGNKKSGIPFVLLHENADIVLLVDWGDGTSQRLTSANYTAGTVTPTHVYPDYRASVHTYAAAGRYTITVASSNWENTYLYVVSFADLLYEGNANSAMWWYRRTLVSVDTPFPKIKGTMCSNSTGGDVDYNATITANSFNYAFMGCQALTTILSNLFDNNTSATNFTHCFDSCTAITSIPPAIFNKHVNATGFTYCFSNCSSLVSIPSNLFVNNTKATDLYYTFYRCTSITSIPAGLFDSQINATRFDNCFYYCTSLTSIPYNLFHKNTKVTGFSWCFSTCTSLTFIPPGLFDKNTSAASFSYCFQNCTALTHIPAGLFDNNTNATGFYDTFTGCTSLASVPNGLFAKNTKVTNFSECFAGCTSLLNFHLKIGSSSVAYFDSFIPDASNVDRILCVPASSTTYTKATAIATANNGIIVSTDIMDCAESWEFTIDTEATTAGDVITGIPIIMYKQTGSIIVDWGDNTTSVLSNDATSWDNGSRSPNEYGSVHEYASPGQYTVTITSTNWSDLYLMYVAQYNPIDSMGNRAHCIAYFRKTLVSVDTILPKVKGIRFGNDDSGTDNSLRELFYDCSHLASIPADLFYNNTSVTSFFGCFYKCTSLASIPIGLFNYNSEATDFECCFSVCSTITSIPSRLFEYNTKATNFTTCFSGTSIISIPSGLFDYNPFATTFGATFANCRAITSIPTGLFDNNSEAVSFARTFQYCAALASIPTDLFKYNVKATNFTGTFRNTSITSIPADLFKYNVNARYFDVCFYSTKITSIPADLFKYNVNATTFGSQAFGGCFESCRSLSSFTLNISSSIVTSAYNFVTLKSTATRIINVPANSATYTKFSNIASSLGLTIVGV